MYPLDNRPTPEFYEEYKRKLAELQELVENQGLSLEIKPGGRCFVVDRTRKDAPEPDKSHLIAYSDQFNSNATITDEVEADKEDYYTYDDYQFFEKMVQKIHEAKDTDVVIDLSPDYIDMTPVEEVKLLHTEEAQIAARFCQEAIRRLDGAQSRLAAWKRITTDYNAGRMVPELRKLKGPRQERALRDWLNIYYDTKFDMYALIHKSKSTRKERKITFHEQQYLLNKLLSPNRIKIGSAIVNLKQMAGVGAIDSTTNERTLRRWCEEWAETHPAEWHQARDGSKYVSERIIKSIRRDDSILKVGQVWVADGHTLSFDIFNPLTGRSQRMTMIMVMDWASRYPVGASLAFTEDSQHILTAFRNAFIHCGQIADNNSGNLAVLPEYVYLDNGKAFRSKLFQEKWEDHDLDKELGGIFPRLDIGVKFAESYNAKAKIIERFFKTFQEQFERFISTFRGACIADKPATLMRNEKWAKKLYTGTPPTIEETMQMIAFYVRYCYGETPHGSLKRKTPYEVFSSARIPEERQIEVSKLNFLMMAMERKNIRSEGIRLNKMIYWHQKLIDYVGQPCIIRYDFSDARWILVYDKHDIFVCQAPLRRTQHAFIEVSMDKAVSHKELNKEYTEIKKLRRDKQNKTKRLVLHTQKSVDNILKPWLESINAHNKALESKSDKSLFTSPPMLEAPPKSPDELFEEMQRAAMRNLPPHPAMMPLAEKQRLKEEQEDKRVQELEAQREQNRQTGQNHNQSQRIELNQLHKNDNQNTDNPYEALPDAERQILADVEKEFKETGGNLNPKPMTQSTIDDDDEPIKPRVLTKEEHLRRIGIIM